MKRSFIIYMVVSLAVMGMRVASASAADWVKGDKLILGTSQFSGDFTSNEGGVEGDRYAGLLDGSIGEKGKDCLQNWWLTSSGSGSDPAVPADDTAPHYLQIDLGAAQRYVILEMRHCYADQNRNSYGWQMCPAEIEVYASDNADGGYEKVTVVNWDEASIKASTDKSAELDLMGCHRYVRLCFTHNFVSKYRGKTSLNVGNYPRVALGELQCYSVRTITDRLTADGPEISFLMMKEGDETVVSIGDGIVPAFSGETSITIPEKTAVRNYTVASISDGAFAGNENLMYIDLSDASGLTVPSVDRTSGMFRGIPEATLVFLPKGKGTVSGSNVISSSADGTQLNCQGLVLEDEKPFFTPKEFKAAFATCSRILEKSDASYTVCLPYAVQAMDGLKLYEFKGIKDKKPVFCEVTKTTAYVPFIADAGADVRLDAKNVVIGVTPASDTEVSGEGGKFIGTVRGMDNKDAGESGILILQSDNMWKPVVQGDENVRVLPFRAYIVTE